MSADRVAQVVEQRALRTDEGRGLRRERPMVVAACVVRHREVDQHRDLALRLGEHLDAVELAGPGVRAHPGKEQRADEHNSA